MNEPLEISMRPRRSNEGATRLRPYLRPTSLWGLVASAHQPDRLDEWTTIPPKVSTDRKSSKGPSVDRNSRSGDNTNICEQQVRSQPAVHFSGVSCRRLCVRELKRSNTEPLTRRYVDSHNTL